MNKKRMVRTDFWGDPIALEEMTPEDKYFYLYLLTNPYTNHIGIYQISKKQMAFETGYSLEHVHLLMEKLIEGHKLICYNPKTYELAIKNWGKDIKQKRGKRAIDCIFAELKDVQDPSLIPYVSESIQNQEIRSLYDSFCEDMKIIHI